MPKTITKSAEQTKKLGQQLAGQLNGGEIFGLTGDLGSGKTVFVQGLAKGLGIKKVVNSPTFVVMKVYHINHRKHQPTPFDKLRATAWQGKITENTRLRQGFGGQAKTIKQLVHVDCYRLDKAQELVDIGIKDYLGQSNTVCIIEWAKRVKQILPKKIKWIKFELGQNDNERIIKITK